MRNRVITLLLALICIACQNEPVQFLLPDHTTTGINFKNTITETDDLNILDYLYFYNGGGVAVGDINNDGLQDIYFSGNQVKNKLYLNKGNLKFEDITTKAGVAGNSTWNTGAIMGDVNGDGLQDIYVCAVVGIKGFDGYNELFINQGDGTFKEEAAKYGLDFDTYSSNAAFIDYDLDGDLDIYLLNHAVHTQNSFGKASLREQRVFETGDKLLRNDGNTFTDVSESAGIFGGVNSYGLGVAVSDFNNDGWPDLYIGNDFHEDDYYYLNQGKDSIGVVRFRESLKTYFGHTSRFSMGNDVADINNDGWPDLISLDMLPKDEKVLKSSEGDDDLQTQKLRTQRYGYHYQFSRNMLYINQKGHPYTETALLSGIAATDWSWSALFADFDLDAQQDLFIANGIPKRPNNLDYIKFVSSDQIQNKISSTKLVDNTALQKMPKGEVPNFIFKGEKNLKFNNKSQTWATQKANVSGASALADLDNDGDIDIITNNLNDYPSIYNNQNSANNNYLKIHFDYTKTNKVGIGTKVRSYHNGILQSKALYTVRGFQASSEASIHFGYGKAKIIDSLRIIWPDQTTQVLTQVATNQTLIISPKNTNKPNKTFVKPPLFTKADSFDYGVDYNHVEDNYLDFNRQKLIPYMVSDRGPAYARGDLNGDGKEDLFFGSSKFKKSQIYLGTDIGFKQTSNTLDSATEEVVATIANLSGNGVNELLIGTAGADFSGKSPRLLDQRVKVNDSIIIPLPIPNNYGNTSAIITQDFDNDGDTDIFIAHQSETGAFGKPTDGMLFTNSGNATVSTFVKTQTTTFANIGMVTDAIWSDYNNDGFTDIITVGEWMTPTFFKNDNGTFVKEEVVSKLNGLWQKIIPFDIDHDGDLDYILGNWGTNSKFSASKENPMLMYTGDFDHNGTAENVIATAKNDTYYALANLDALAGQMNTLHKKYDSYAAFAGLPLDEIFEDDSLDNAQLLEVHTLQSGYLKNNNGTFEFVPFDATLQVAPITTGLVFDFDNDQKDELLLAGNYFGVKPYHGRYDSFSGALIKDENAVTLGHLEGLDLTQKSARHIDVLTIENKKYLLVVFNNERAQLYAINN